MLLLFICILEYLSSALGSIDVEHHSASSTSSNIQFPVSKAGSTSVRNNQNGPHPHETWQKEIIVNPLKEDYKLRKGNRKGGWT